MRKQKWSGGLRVKYLRIIWKVEFDKSIEWNANTDYRRREEDYTNRQWCSFVCIVSHVTHMCNSFLKKVWRRLYLYHINIWSRKSLFAYLHRVFAFYNLEIYHWYRVCYLLYYRKTYTFITKLLLTLLYIIL